MKNLLKSKYFYRLLLVVVFISGCIPARSASLVGNRGLHALTLSHGLSDLLVNVIFKDSTGFVWFGTESSVDRFDGNNIISFPIEGDSRRSRRVLAIAEGPDGVIYIGTSQGLFQWRKGDPDLTRLVPDKIDFHVTSFAVTASDLIYIGTRNGLFIYNTKNHKLEHKLLVNDNLSNENEIIGLKYESDGRLYILTAHKIWCMTPDSDRLSSFRIPSKDRATRICEIGKTLYIGTEGDGVLSFNTDSDSFGKSFKPGNGVVTSLSPTADNNLLVGTDGEGIYLYDPSTDYEIYHLTSSASSPRQLRANSVYSTLSDDRGLLWIGYYQGGADYTPFEYPVVTFQNNPVVDELSKLSIRDLAVDDVDGHLVLAGTPEGLEFYDKAKGTLRTIAKPEIDSNVIFSIAYLNGLFYVGTFHGGLYTFNPATGAVNHFGPDDLKEASVFKIKTDLNGDLWVASSQGLYRFEKANASKYQRYTSANSQLPSGNVYEIFFDSSGRGWICTENGVAVWNGSHLQASGFPDGFVNNMKIRVVFEDSDHNLYFAPDRGEVWKSDLALQKFGPLAIGAPGRFSQFTSISQDGDGWLWLGTDKGLVRFNPKNEKYVVYNNADHIINSVYTLSTPILENGGSLWLGTTEGMHKVDIPKAGEFQQKLKEFKLTVTDVTTGGSSIAGRLKQDGSIYRIPLSKDEPDITVYVSDFSHRYMESVELEYLLEGVDSEWRWTDACRPIEYRGLQPGSYTLKIREAGNPDSEIQLAIEKKGSLLWLWMGLLIFIILAGGALWFSIFTRRRTDNELLARLAAEAQAEAAHRAESDSGKKQAAYSTTRLSDEECRRLHRKLEAVMKTEKPYTDPDLKSKELAAKIGCTAHALSFLFNQYLHKSYYDYVNEYRVEEFKRMVKEADISKYTLTSLAERCGFSSRASFFRHFKAITGQTPAEYLKN